MFDQPIADVIERHVFGGSGGNEREVGERGGGGGMK